MKRLPYYVEEDLDLLKSAGMSQDAIDLFVQKLNEKEPVEVFHADEAEQVIQRIIAYVDIPTRLK